MRHDPRGRSVKYNVKEGNEEGLEEEDDVEYDHHELDDHVLEEDIEELVETDDVADNVHEDDIDDDMMIKNDIDGDDDMDNPYHFESRSDDINDYLNEEDDEVH